VWDKSQQYLKKMGGVILLASIVIWFLGYFPRNNNFEEVYSTQITTIESQFDQKTINEKDRDQQITDLEDQFNIDQASHSYIGKLGHFMEPVVTPLGFDWRIGVSIVSGMAAKEVVVSTLSVLYTGQNDEENQQSLQDRLVNSTKTDGSPTFTPLVVISFLLFILIYFPCIATIAAIKEEAGSWKWAIFSIVYSTSLAWIISFAVFQIGSLFS